MSYRGSTYAIAAYDSANEEWGCAVQSKFLSVGSLVPWIGDDGGIILTLAKTNANYGKEGLNLIKSKLDCNNIRDILIMNDPLHNMRQLGIIDLKGNISGYTGENCLDYCGFKYGDNYICIGNTLAGENVLYEMSKAFKNGIGDLADRLISALIAGQNAGGDKRGMESSSLIINGKTNDNIGEINKIVDLRVDCSKSPIDELRKLLDLHRVEYSTNHKFKYFNFTPTIKVKLTEMISKILGKPYTEEDFNSIVTIYEEGIVYSKPIFIKDSISGEFVDKIVTDYYQFEYNQLS